MDKLNFEKIGEVFDRVTDTEEWTELQSKFNYCNDIFIIGHGGNLAVADHASADISRLSNGTKNAQAPGSAILATSLINDTSFDDWMVQWLQQRTTSHRRSTRQISCSWYFFFRNIKGHNPCTRTCKFKGYANRCNYLLSI